MSTKTREAGLILYEKTEKVATLTLNRPDKLNTLDENVYSELDAALSTAERDRTVRAIVITGAGRCFSAGSYIKGPRSKGVLEEWEKRDSVSLRRKDWDLLHASYRPGKHKRLLLRWPNVWRMFRLLRFARSSVGSR